MPVRLDDPFAMAAAEEKRRKKLLVQTPTQPAATQLAGATNTAPANWGGSALPKGATSTSLNTIGVSPGQWFSTNNLFYKAGESKGYSMDEYRDLTQPGWRDAAKQLSANQTAQGNVLVDDGRGNKFYAPQSKAVQDANGVWRPAGYAPPSPSQTTSTGTTGTGSTGGTGGTATGTTASPAPAQTPGTVSIQERPISPALQAAIDEYKSILRGTPVTAADIMNSPEYKAQADAIQALATRNAGIASSNARRSLAGRNMLQSSPAVQALAGIESDYQLRSAADQAALIPQTLNAAYARQQGQLQNYQNFISTLSDAEKQAWNQSVEAFTTTAPYNLLTQGQIQQNQQWATGQTGQLPDGSWTQQGRANEAGLTGVDPVTGKPIPMSPTEQAKMTNRYIVPEAKDAISRIIYAKQQFSADPANAAFWKAEADAARSELASNPEWGIDPTLFGTDVSLEQAKKNFFDVTLTPEQRAVMAKANLDEQLKVAQIAREEAQQALDEARATTERLKTDPKSAGYREAEAKAKAAEKDLNKIDAELKKIEAEIAKINAETRKANADAVKSANAETPAQKAAREATEKAEEEDNKARKERIDDYTKEYVVDRGAAELWEDYGALISAGKEDGTPYTSVEAGALINQMAQSQGLSQGTNWEWLKLMWQVRHNPDYAQWAQEQLNTDFRRKPFEKSNRSKTNEDTTNADPMKAAEEAAKKK